jgi:hypothetical protein
MTCNTYTNVSLRNAPTITAYRAAYLRASRFPKPAAIGFGPILRIMSHPQGHDMIMGGWPVVELPKDRSKVHKSLVTHPRLMAVQPGFGDDTIDGETFFYSAHHCTWSEGKRFAPYQITHIASGGMIQHNFVTRAEADAAAAKLVADPAVDWDAIDADHESIRGKASLRAVLHNLKEQGLR